MTRHHSVTAPVSPRQASELLGEVADLRRTTRRSLGAPWFPLVTFGSLIVLSAPLVAAYSINVLAGFWALAAPAGLLLVRRHYRARGLSRGVTGRGRRSWVVGIALSVACGAAGAAGGALGGATAGLLAPVWVVVAGYLAFGLIQNHVAPSLGVGACAAVATAVAAGGGSPWLVELLFGVGLIAVGALLGLTAEGS